MMELFSPAVTVLALSFVIGYHSSLTGGAVAIKLPLNNTVNIVQWAEAFQKRDATKPQLCGRIKVVTSPLSRSNNIFKDDGDDLYDDIDDDEHLDRIFGGTYAAYGEFPWQVGVYSLNQYICSAAIISEFWIISAAHCFEYEQSSYRLSVGDHRLYHQDSHEVKFEVDTIIHHELHGKTGFDNDIALIKIKAASDGRGIGFNDYVQPICLPYLTEDPPPGVELTISGWGRTGANSGISTVLKKTKLMVNDMDVCRRSYNGVTDKKAICGFNLERDSEICSGDSGGPAASLNAGFAVLIGINAWSGSCGVPATPSGFSNVPLHRSWIDATIRLHSNGSEGVLPERGFPGG